MTIAIIDTDHYKKITVDGKEVYEHRYVIEQVIGRKLTSEEEVHHKNRKRSDNSLENLVLCANHAEHKSLHAKEDCESAGYDFSIYRWCSYHQEYELRETFGKHPARCKKGTNEYRFLHGLYNTVFD